MGRVRAMSLKLALISDTHRLHREVVVPACDLLIHAGDITGGGAPREVQAFDRWLGTLSQCRQRVVIAGNHDWCFERTPVQARRLITNAVYLQDEEATVAGLRIYGSPWQPWFCDWAFNLRRGPQLRVVWDRIPAGIDVLVTHGPPRGHGDRTSDGRNEGCDDLLEAVQRVRPRLHVFGHIHEAYGVTREGETTFVNASSCTLDYQAQNPPVVFELD